MSLLSLSDLHSYYGDHYVLQGVSLEVAERSVVALLGGNGVGKSTTLHSVIGFTPPRRGEILFRGEPVQGLAPHRIARRGVALVPQGKRLFPSLSVRETLCMAARPGEWTLQRIFELFPVLARQQKLQSTLLSGGEQQMLIMGRALMLNPSLILMDEPTEGLAPIIVRQLGGIIERLKEEGLTILLVEQNLEMALSVADTAYIMSSGKIVHADSAQSLREDRETQARFLGATALAEH